MTVTTAPHRALTMLVAATTVLLPASKALSATVDLTTDAWGKIDTAIFTRDDSQPTGTGVFNPFLSLQHNPIEQGYNTSGGEVLDTTRVPQWTHNLQLGQLQAVTVNGGSYYQFTLDANETGNGNINRLLSIDNIRIYTSATGSQVTTDVNSLGICRYALNPLGNSDNWIMIDSTMGSTSGSGSSDLIAYIPTSAFDGVSADDFVYFYNLNGAHFQSDDGTSADAGFEEWNALTGPATVPDGGNTLVLFGSAITALGLVAGRRKMAANV